MDTPVRHRQKIILGSAVDIDDISAVHGIDVHIDGVNGVGDKYGVIPAEKVGDVSCVGLSSVGNEYLVNVKLNAEAAVMFGDSLSQKIIALLGTVAAEGLSLAHFIGCSVHSLYDSFPERKCYITYAKTYYRSFGVFLFKSADALCDIAEQITFFQLKKIFVKFSHSFLR